MISTSSSRTSRNRATDALSHDAIFSFNACSEPPLDVTASDTPQSTPCTAVEPETESSPKVASPEPSPAVDASAWVVDDSAWAVDASAREVDASAWVVDASAWAADAWLIFSQTSFVAEPEDGTEPLIVAIANVVAKAPEIVAVTAVVVMEVAAVSVVFVAGAAVKPAIVTALVVEVLAVVSGAIVVTWSPQDVAADVVAVAWLIFSQTSFVAEPDSSPQSPVARWHQPGGQSGLSFQFTKWQRESSLHFTLQSSKFVLGQPFPKV